jgi:uncharacterized protein (DUF1501 family)
MKQQNQLSRRDLIASISALALAGAVMPKLQLDAHGEKDGYIVLNGWVLKRSEAA